MSAAVSVSAAD